MQTNNRPSRHNLEGLTIHFRRFRISWIATHNP